MNRIGYTLALSGSVDLKYEAIDLVAKLKEATKIRFTAQPIYLHEMGDDQMVDSR